MPAALNPFKHPWQAAKAPFLIAYYRLQGGAITANPYGTLKTLRYVYGTILYPDDAPRPRGMDIALSETDTEGFAIYGTVRVSGTNVIP